MSRRYISPPCRLHGGSGTALLLRTQRMKVTVFLNVASRSLLAVDRHGGSKRLWNVGHFITSLHSATSHRTSCLHTRRRENLKSHLQSDCYCRSMGRVVTSLPLPQRYIPNLNSFRAFETFNTLPAMTSQLSHLGAPFAAQRLRYLTLLSNGWHSCVVLRRSRVQISAWRQALLTEVLVVLFSLSMQMPG
jgi:hypothetical protein